MSNREIPSTPVRVEKVLGSFSRGFVPPRKAILRLSTKIKVFVPAAWLRDRDIWSRWFQKYHSSKDHILRVALIRVSYFFGKKYRLPMHWKLLEDSASLTELCSMYLVRLGVKTRWAAPKGDLTPKSRGRVTQESGKMPLEAGWITTREPVFTREQPTRPPKKAPDQRKVGRKCKTCSGIVSRHPGIPKLMYSGYSAHIDRCKEKVTQGESLTYWERHVFAIGGHMWGWQIRKLFPDFNDHEVEVADTYYKKAHPLQCYCNTGKPLSMRKGVPKLSLSMLGAGS